MSAPLFKKTREAYRLFYPMAALWAALSVLIWVAQYVGFHDFGISSQDHAHEMIYGFALAVMTGFLLNGVKRINLYVLTSIWILGRLVPFIEDSPTFLLPTLQLAFPIVLALLVAVPLFKNAKTWRNLTFAPILAAFTLGELIYQFAPDKGILLGLNLTCAMVFMMGGRVVTAVTNGFMQKMDMHLKPGAQSYWEEKGFFALIILIIGDLSHIHFISFAGTLVLSVALVMRIYRWEPLRFWKNPQCIWLHIGFSWLLAGIILRMIGFYIEGPFTILGIHTITIAALGTLTLTIMSRTTLQRIRKPIHLPTTILFSLGVINFGLFARILMETTDSITQWTWVSGILFGCGYILFLFWFFLTSKKK